MGNIDDQYLERSKLLKSSHGFTSLHKLLAETVAGGPGVQELIHNQS